MSDAGKHHVELDHFDLLTLGSALRVCDMSMVLLGSMPKPHAVLGSTFVDDAVLCTGRYDFSFRGRFRLPQGWCLVGYVHETRPGSWCHGVQIKPGMSITLMSGGVSELMLSAGTCWSVAVLPVERLRHGLANVAACAIDSPSRHMMLFEAGDDAVGRRLRQRFEDQLAYLHGDGTAKPQDVDGLVADHVLAFLTSNQTSPWRRTRGRRMHYRIVRRVEDFMFANLREDIRNEQLSNAACTSERNLRYAFNDVMDGVSPNRYLSYLRLCEACRNLAISDMHRHSVKSIALNCGMWDLSRFAEHYRHLFGELPRQTLKRSGAHGDESGVVSADRFTWRAVERRQAG